LGQGLRGCLIACLALAGAGAGAAPPSPAAEQLAVIRGELAHAKAASDWPAYQRAARRQRVFLNASPLSELELARAELQLGHAHAASAAAWRFLAMGQSHPLLQSPLFAPIHPALAPGDARNGAPVSRARQALRLPDAGLVAEDIDHDPKSGRFFVSSILEHKVVALTPQGDAATFAASPNRWPMLAVKVDVGRRRLWATEVALAGFDGVADADAGHSAVLEYELDTGERLQRVDGPAGGALGDMVLTSDGEPLVADGQGGGIYRLQAGALRRIDHGDFISPQTPAICADGRAFVPDYLRGVGELNLRTGGVRWFASQGRHALAGIDGLYCRGHLLIATQNGSSPQRVVAFRLNRAKTAIVGETVIERTPSTDPTHGVFVGAAFYYIANAGWAALDDHGHVSAGAKQSPAIIMAATPAQYSTWAR
jgi:hypothetical protein